MAETEVSVAAEEVPRTPAKEVVAESPSTKASTGMESEPTTPATGTAHAQDGEAASAAPAETPRAVPATPNSAGSARAHTGANSTPLATPRSARSGTRTQPPAPVGHCILNLSTFKASPRYTFQPPVRDMSSLKVPGPGAYDAPSSPRGVASTMAGKKAVKVPNETPGPGAHENPTSIGKGTKHSIGRPLHSKPAMVPGPGSYEAKGLFSGPKFSVGLPRQGLKTQVPGPGAYDHEKFTTIQQNAQYSMPTSPRQKGVKCEDIPGPGAHPKKTSVGEGPKFSVGLPQKKRAESTPGPGEYCGHFSTFHV